MTTHRLSLRSYLLTLSLAAALAGAPTVARADDERSMRNPTLHARTRTALVGIKGGPALGTGFGLRMDMGLFTAPRPLPMTLALGLDLGVTYRAGGALTEPGTPLWIRVPAALVASWRFELGPIGLGLRLGVAATLQYVGRVRSLQPPSWSRDLIVGGIAGVQAWLPARSAGLFGSLDLLFAGQRGVVLTAGLAV